MKSEQEHLAFKECWKEINKLALEARPKKFEEAKERFQQPPDSWSVKEAIQSERIGGAVVPLSRRLRGK